MRLVLDAEALSALLDNRHKSEKHVRRAVDAARRLGREVVVPAVTLAEIYRGAGRSASLDALLSRGVEGALVVRDTDRSLARLVGAVLAQAEVGSAYLADAHPVAVAIEGGGGVILTGDPDDLNMLAAPYRSIVVKPLAGTGRRRR